MSVVEKRFSPEVPELVDTFVNASKAAPKAGSLPLAYAEYNPITDFETFEGTRRFLIVRSMNNPFIGTDDSRAETGKEWVDITLWKEAKETRELIPDYKLEPQVPEDRLYQGPFRPSEIFRVLSEQTSIALAPDLPVSYKSPIVIEFAFDSDSFVKPQPLEMWLELLKGDMSFFNEGFQGVEGRTWDIIQKYFIKKDFELVLPEIDEITGNQVDYIFPINGLTASENVLGSTKKYSINKDTGKISEENVVILDYACQGMKLPSEEYQIATSAGMPFQPNDGLYGFLKSQETKFTKPSGHFIAALVQSILERRQLPDDEKDKQYPLPTDLSAGDIAYLDNLIGDLKREDFDKQNPHRAFGVDRMKLLADSLVITMNSIYLNNRRDWQRKFYKRRT